MCLPYPETEKQAARYVEAYRNSGPSYASATRTMLLVFQRQHGWLMNYDNETCLPVVVDTSVGVAAVKAALSREKITA